MLEALIVPLIAATAFTLGGYGITKAGRYADELGDLLGSVFVIVAVVVGLALLTQIVNRGPKMLSQDRVYRAALYN